MADLNVSVTARDVGGLTASAVAVITTIPVATGWTMFTPTEPSGEGDAFAGAGTRKVYVSQSTGSDSNAGTFLAPYKTLTKGKAAVRNGKPDWLLLKKGDTWTNEAFGFLGVSGQSQTAPMLISSYSSGARPLIKTPANVENAIGAFNNGSNLAIVDLAFYAHTRDPASPTFVGSGAEQNGFFFLGPLTNLLVEGCKFSFYNVNAVQGDSGTAGNVTLRRNVIADNYSVSSHSQGVYLDKVSNPVLVENTFDHNGWSNIAGQTIFNHNLYIQYNCGLATITGNIFANASSHGAQVRPGGSVTGNLFVRNPIGLMIGSNEAGQLASTATVSMNVVLEGNDIGASGPRGYGIDMYPNTGLVQVQNNVIAHDASSKPWGHAVQITSGANNDVVTNNTIFQWRGDDGNIILNQGTGNVVTPNAIDQTGYPAPTRSVGSYYSSIGGAPATLAGFLAAARGQSRDNWNPALMAGAVNSYIRAGFGL